MRKWLRQWLGIEDLERRLGRVPRTQRAENALVAEWLLERENHPPGSPKHTAYTNRLRELGVPLGD